ncbi:hypothetical protein KIN20_027077 [Parelaphostrongylus tenuis]|uniref:Uncharacterized protein n=1 Tax=Parelaphostrongylus tenuis TaxID=148309 RepID=A0AAD5QYX9_PARTN|nr:hypothetical protein KIN20_027077 [Parelaphostrongylus tenuis]
MLMNPMVLMLVLPLVIMLIIPKMTANDPQLQKEIAEMQLPKMDMPDVSEMMANLFGGGTSKPKKKSNFRWTAEEKQVKREFDSKLVNSIFAHGFENC